MLPELRCRSGRPPGARQRTERARIQAQHGGALPHARTTTTTCASRLHACRLSISKHTHNDSSRTTCPRAVMEACRVLKLTVDQQASQVQRSCFSGNTASLRTRTDTQTCRLHTMKRLAQSRPYAQPRAGSLFRVSLASQSQAHQALSLLSPAALFTRGPRLTLCHGRAVAAAVRRAVNTCGCRACCRHAQGVAALGDLEVGKHQSPSKVAWCRTAPSQRCAMRQMHTSTHVQSSVLCSA